MNDEITGVVTRSTGFTERVHDTRDKIPEFDYRSGNHFWIMITSFKVDPVKAIAGEQLMDHESLVNVIGPLCYYCEKAYSSTLLHRRCTGEPK